MPGFQFWLDLCRPVSRGAVTLRSADPASARYLRGELTPGPDVATDAELEAFVRQRASTSYHPSGTCRMGADDGAVVDGEARVTGVQGLRVVDASIMPRVVTGNLNARS